MRNTTLTMLTAFGASLCCTGPVIFTSFGATSLAGFTILEPLRPYFSLAALGLLGIAFWRSYRPAAEMACCSIEEQAQLSRQRGSLWLTSIVVAGFLAFPYLLGGTVFASNDISQEVEQVDSQQSVWTIEGMTCSGCALGLEASLNREPGMENCKVHYERAGMECQIDGVKLKTTDVPELLTQYGYVAKQVTQIPAG